jgi:hypothetical protein
MLHEANYMPSCGRRAISDLLVLRDDVLKGLDLPLKLLEELELW